MVSTPYMDEATLCDRIALMQDGQIMRLDTPKNIIRDFNGHLVTLQTPDIFQLLKVMEQYTAHCTFYPYGENLHVIFYEPLEKAIPEFEAFLQQNDITHGEIKQIEPNIEDCFIEIVKGN